MKFEPGNDIWKKPFSVFFKEAILRTPQGLAFLAGSMIKIAETGLIYFYPDLFGISGHTVFTTLLIFLIYWLFIVFVIFVFALSVIDFRPSWIMTILIIIFMYWFS